MKACKSVPSWKYFSCQNVKAGDILNINLFLCLSLAFSVSVRNGFDAVQICPISSPSPFTVVRWGQLGPSSASSLLSTRLEQSICLSLFFPKPLPGTTYWPQRADLKMLPPLLYHLHSLSVSLTLSSLEAPLAPRPTVRGSYLLPCWHLLLMSHEGAQVTSTSGK